MPFVKLDTGMLNSTLWVERECRELFITALLMAEPKEITEPMPQIAIRSLDETGWAVPPGWYGFVAAAGVGIIRRAIIDHDVGLVALEKLGAPDHESRSLDFEGRRLVRVDGGFIVLNYMKYRERDYTTAERSKRYREKKNATAPQRDLLSTHRDITQAEAEAEANKRSTPIAPSDKSLVASIPIIGGREWGVRQTYLTELELAYPNVDGKQTLQEIRAWCISNPNQRKTERGVMRFINSWFAREQNKPARQ